MDEYLGAGPCGGQERSVVEKLFRNLRPRRAHLPGESGAVLVHTAGLFAARERDKAFREDDDWGQRRGRRRLGFGLRLGLESHVRRELEPAVVARFGHHASANLVTSPVGSAHSTSKVSLICNRISSFENPCPSLSSLPSSMAQA